MRHYEIIYLVHPDYQGEQLKDIENRYRTLIEAQSGKVHRFEDLGRRHLAYAIKKVHKAHYFLMNIECNQTTLDELNNLFRYSDAILRHLVVAKTKAVTEASELFKQKEDKQRDLRGNTHFRQRPRQDMDAEQAKPSAGLESGHVPDQMAG